VTVVVNAAVDNPFLLARIQRSVNSKIATFLSWTRPFTVDRDCCRVRVRIGADRVTLRIDHGNSGRQLDCSKGLEAITNSWDRNVSLQRVIRKLSLIRGSEREDASRDHDLSPVSQRRMKSTTRSSLAISKDVLVFGDLDVQV